MRGNRNLRLLWLEVCFRVGQWECMIMRALLSIVVAWVARASTSMLVDRRAGCSVDQGTEKRLGKSLGDKWLRMWLRVLWRLLERVSQGRVREREMARRVFVRLLVEMGRMRDLGFGRLG